MSNFATGILIFIYLFIYFWLRWVFVAVRGLSLVAASGGFSCCGARALGAWASVVVARGLSSCDSQALERRLSSCGTRAQLLRGMWDPPRPGIEPASPALAGGFLTTVPPVKSLGILILIEKVLNKNQDILSRFFVKCTYQRLFSEAGVLGISYFCG